MKKVLIGLAAFALVVASVPMFAAFEAHVINVTAKIENALNVNTEPIAFGTVFPQEQLDKQITIGLSDSFAAERNADDVEYVIKQKPKCWSETAQKYGRVTESGTAGEQIYVCEDGAGYVILPVLCPYLSKHDADPIDQNDDAGIPAFHGSIAWTIADTESTIVHGKLAKSQNDSVDNWTIDLKVPCFANMCAQDWASYVIGINPGAIPANYVQPIANEHKLFGCDLWVEVTGVSRVVQPGVETTSLSLENKDANWNVISGDQIFGTLVFNSAWPTFKYTLTAQGLTPNTSYSLIYYADPYPGNNPGAFIGSHVTDGSGVINTAGDVELNLDLPTAPDTNYPGAKIWLVPSTDYDSVNKSIIGWNPTAYLHEYNLITYDDTNN